MNSTKCGGSKGPKQSNTTITVDEWQRAIESAMKSPKCAEGVTSEELGIMLGVGKTTALGHIRKAITAGIMEFVGRRQQIRIDGKANYIPVYGLVKRGKGK